MSLFEKAENTQVKLETSDMVIAEIVWVLESYYDFSKPEIREVVVTILGESRQKGCCGA